MISANKSQTPQDKTSPRYWYVTHVTECVLCGRSEIYRQRRYDDRPPDPVNRYVFEQFVCPEHLL